MNSYTHEYKEHTQPSVAWMIAMVSREISPVTPGSCISFPDRYPGVTLVMSGFQHPVTRHCRLQDIIIMLHLSFLLDSILNEMAQPCLYQDQANRVDFL